MTHLQLCIPPPEPNGIPQFQLAAAIDKTWGKRQLRVRFLSGDTQIRTKVAEIAKKWEEHCDVNFKFVDSGVSDVRVNIDASGRSWSNLGTDALLVAANSPTMNFGWLTQSSSDTEYNRVVLHEFGHALGLIHEHRSPAANIPWNKPVVRDYYITELGWTAQEVERNIFDSADVSTTNFSDFDPQSIMLYSIPNEHTIGNFSVGWNTVLSSRDKSFVGEVYPNSAKGYQEAHRRLRSVWRMPVPAGAPAIEELQFPRGSIANQLQVVSGRSIEAKWIGYIIHHVVGNHPNADGYKELHRRLSQVWKQSPPAGQSAIQELKFPEGSIENQLKSISGRSAAAKWIGYIIHHVVGNPPDETGYKELHRRLVQVWKQIPPVAQPAIQELQFPQGSIENQLKVLSGRSMEAKWIGYIIHHIVGNTASLT